MAVASLAVIGVGLLLILAGLYVSLAEWNSEHRRTGRPGGVGTDPLGAEEVLTGLQKLADALLKHSLGFRLIIIGFGLVLVGGIIGGVSGL